MFEISYPDNTEDIIDKIRATIGREIVWHTQTTLSGCSSCSLDPISRKSTDSFCEECGGEYWIPIYEDITVTGVIIWKDNMDTLGWRTGGQTFEGDCRVQIKYNSQNENIVNTSGYVTVDGRDLTRKDKAYKGVPEINRIIVDLELKEGN